MAYARFGSRLAREVVEVADNVECLERGGFWAVVMTFEGEVTCVRLAQVTKTPATTTPVTTTSVTTTPVTPAGLSQGSVGQGSAGRGSAQRGRAGQGSAGQLSQPGVWAPLTGDWVSSLGETQYRAGVVQIRDRIAAGEVYQVNLCRVMSHPLADDADLAHLETLVAQGNPAPFAARICVPEAGLDVLSASPEAFLIRRAGRIESRPIKGTATTMSSMLAKDYAENVMIADLVRNDLSAVCRPGTVSVDALCAPQEHPGLTHLVSTVSGQLRPGVAWAEIMSATFPPGSVSGAPKLSALQVIGDLETVPRGPYCGAIGWVDGDTGEAELAVGIRTFWAERDTAGQRWLRFGTGAGITWGSDPAQEWAETELKAARLVGLAWEGGTVTTSEKVESSQSDEIRVWVNGELVDPAAGSIAALDHGVTVGDGVFETCKVVDGVPFALERHARRLDRSMAGLGLPPADHRVVDAGIRAVLAGEPIAFGRLRYSVTGGAGPLGSDRDDSPLTYIATAGSQPPNPESGKLVVVPWARNERSATAGLKTTSYAENVVALDYAKKRGGVEALFANTIGNLCECTGSNVFVVVDGEILTPDLASGPLAGITRELVVLWCREEGLTVREQVLPMSILEQAAEVFITSSTKDVMAVHSVDDRPLPAPGPLTARAAEIFARRSHESLNP